MGRKSADSKAKGVLEDWRDVQRQLEDLGDGTPEAIHLQAEAARL